MESVAFALRLGVTAADCDMAKPQVLILRAPGTNCDEETAFAFQLAGAQPQLVHINRLLATPKLASDFQVICFPGGFSYGDDLAAGRILANQMDVRLSDCLNQFRDDGNLILGICNGFQVLIKSGLLVPEDELGLPATLTWNDSGRFEDRWVNLQTSSSKCHFLTGIDKMYLPVAHAEGKFVRRNEAVHRRLEENGQLALRYFQPDSSNGFVPFPFNPNGSEGDVAGMCDETGRVFGLMPHPERHVDPTHHPRWTREGLADKGDGLAVFENAVRFFQ